MHRLKADRVQLKFRLLGANVGADTVSSDAWPCWSSMQQNVRRVNASGVCPPEDQPRDFETNIGCWVKCRTTRYLDGLEYLAVPDDRRADKCFADWADGPLTPCLVGAGLE